MEEDGQLRIRGNIRSAIDKERTKIRERERRSITSKIFHGLRQHGGYRLSPRADINQVLRHLAQEAGWVVEPDGTTYRSNLTTTTSTTSNGIGVCPLYGGGRKGPMTMPTSSFIGEQSTTTLPHRITMRDATTLDHSSLYGGCGSSYTCSSNNTPIPTSCLSNPHDTQMAIYTCNAMPEKPSAAASIVHQKKDLLPQVQASGQNTLHTPVEPPQYLTWKC